jgi:hypothetical protein
LEANDKAAEDDIRIIASGVDAKKNQLATIF